MPMQRTIEIRKSGIVKGDQGFYEIQDGRATTELQDLAKITRNQAASLVHVAVEIAMTYGLRSPDWPDVVLRTPMGDEFSLSVRPRPY